jgi:hypothetical protein
MKSAGAVQKQAEHASRDAERVLEQPKQVERCQAQGDNREGRVLEQPEQDVRGVPNCNRYTGRDEVSALVGLSAR